MIAQTQEPKIYSPEEYLEFEISSEERHEYIAGEIIPMTGGTPNHNQLAGNFYAALSFALRKQPYRVFITDQRLWIPQGKIYTYPDVLLVSQPIEYAENRRDTLINPLLIGEVLSKSTRNYDKDEKFLAYRTIPTFQEYILIDQYTLHVEHYTKVTANKWLFTEYNSPTDLLSLTSVPLQIEIAELYDKVDFENSTS